MKVFYSTLLALLLAESSFAFTSTNHGIRQPSFWSVRSMVKDSPSSIGSDVRIPYDAAARLAYDEWRNIFSKGDFDTNRYEIFKTNYETITVANVSAKKKAREEGIASLTLLSLNEFGDLTEEEYKKAIASGSKPMSTGDVLNKAVENAELQSEASSALGEAFDALAEEEKKLAEKLGLKSVDELEVALDSLEGIAPDGGELDSENISREARIRDSYLKWCKEFKKQPDESRFPTFSNNFLLMEQYAKETNKEMNLNQYADCTKEEYEAMLNSKVGINASSDSGLESAARSAVEAKEAEEAELEARRKAAEQAEKEAAKAREMRSNEIANRAKVEAERRKQIDEERAIRLKQQDAASAKKQAELEASVIATAKADTAKQAQMSAQRAKLEADAADKARKEAREWADKQKRIAANNAAAAKKMDKPKSVGLPSFFAPPSTPQKKQAPAAPKVIPAVMAAKPIAPSPSFSFFSPKPPAPVKTSPKVTPKPAPVPVMESKKTASPAFSFFAPPAPAKVPAPKPVPVVEVKKAAPAPAFSFFGAPKDTPKSPVKVTPKPDVKVLNRPGTQSIFGSSPKPAPKVEQKKSGTINLFGGGPSKPKPDVKVPNRPGTISLKKQSPPPTKSTPSFSFFGSPSPAPAPKVQPAPVERKPAPTFSIFGSSAAAPASKVQTPKPKTAGTFSLFGNAGSNDATKKAPPKGVPVLSQWKQNADGSITGKVSNSPNYKPGTQITTSPVGKGAKAGLVKTGSGSQYYLN